MNDQYDTICHPLDLIKLSNDTVIYNEDSNIVKKLSKIFEHRNNCICKQLRFQYGVFHVLLTGDIRWLEKIEQPELFDIEYVLINGFNDSWMIINENGQLVEKEATDKMIDHFKWYPITPSTKRSIWDWLNLYLKSYQSIYRVSDIFLNKIDGSCKIIVKNIKQEIE